MSEQEQAARDAEFEQRQNAKKAALAAHGFADTYPVGGLFGGQVAPCLTCGALVPLPLGLDDGEFNAIAAHVAWHAAPDQAASDGGKS